MWLAASLLGVAIVVEVARHRGAAARGGVHPSRVDRGSCSGGYALSIWLLALVVRQIPVSVAYAVWSGAGTALVAAAGLVFLGERLDVVKVAGLLAIIAGVVVLNLSAAAH